MTAELYAGTGRRSRLPGHRSPLGLRVLLVVTMASTAFSCGATGAKPPSDSYDTETLAAIDRGKSYERQRRYDKARAEYQRAVELAPDGRNRAKAYRTLAAALIFWGDYAGAASALGGAVGADPSDAGSWHNLGMVRHKRGELDLAEQAFRRSIKLVPEDPRSQVALAALLINQKRFDAAAAIYSQLLNLEIAPSLRSAVEKALVIIEQERAAAAPN